MSTSQSSAPSSSRSAPSSSWARETLASSLIISQRLRAALLCPWLLLFHHSQWQCLASSCCAVTNALILMLDQACSVLEPLEQESMCQKLDGPLRALHQAVQEGETCMQGSTLPASSSTSTVHSWLLEKALKLGPSTEVVDLHLQRLLWTSSIVMEQISRCAPNIDDIGFDILSEQTKHLCEIWSHVDAEDDLLTAKSLLNRIIEEEEEGDTRQLAHFILQKMSCPELSGGRIADSNDLPPFLWVDPKELKKDAEIIGEGSFACVQEAVWLGGRFAVKDFHYVPDNVAFGREMIIQAQLHHPNVIPLVCCSYNRPLQKCSLVMERMQGDLHGLITQRKGASGMESAFPDLLLAVDLMLQIAQGIEYLHSDSLHIIHRDIKSTNILVGSSSGSLELHDVSTPHVHLKVADFGMSKAKHTSSKYTTKEVGATRWRAPEVFEVDPEASHQPQYVSNARYTNKADVYSFSMVCYEILSGEVPFADTVSNRTVCGKVLRGERPILPENCPPALASYIALCWHADPEQRPTFTQICRMLRYFKACIFLGDHDGDQNAAERNINWLLRPLTTSMWARMDDMLQSSAVLQQLGGVLRPHVLVIPLEMYCCRVVLQEIRYEADIAHEFGSSRRNWDHGILERVAEDDQSSVINYGEGSGDETDIGVGSGDGIHESMDEGGGSTSMWLDDPRPPAGKGYFKRAWKWVKKLSWARQDHQLSSAELRNELGLMGRDFSYKELCRATYNFSSTTFIGEGGEGKVYRGQLMSGLAIAVKVYRENSFQHGSFKQELSIASQLRHRNIVPLMGWCIKERNEILLVYEYMPNGDLGKHIFSADETETVMTWQHRYKAMLQVAEALKYLHQDSGYRQIVHRDVKTANIMLDSEWNARLGDCGLAVVLDERHSPSTSFPVAGTMGYLAPDYAYSGQLSPASDVYSFGVTVLEIATGRRAVFRNSENSNRHIVEWVKELHRQGEVMRAADVRLALHNSDESEMRRVLVLGLACTNEDPQARPTMADVIRILSTASDPPPLQDLPLTSQYGSGSDYNWRRNSNSPATSDFDFSTQP